MGVWDRVGSLCGRAALTLGGMALVWSVGVLALSCGRAPETPRGRAFATPEAGVAALAAAVRASDVNELVAIFGPDANDLVAASDPLTARRRREVIAAAFGERWQLVDGGSGAKTLVIGNESWPFPIPLAKDAGGWRFDVAAGKEEVIARRIGRNELAAILVCRTYVAAQRLYARSSHDGQPAGLFAKVFRSDPGRHNGLYWPATHREKRSPLGDLVADAALQGRTAEGTGAAPTPFHGYYFTILTVQGPGFALVAWPAEYDITGVMSFTVNQDGVVNEKDLGADTGAVARAMTAYNTDATWKPVQ